MTHRATDGHLRDLPHRDAAGPAGRDHSADQPAQPAARLSDDCGAGAGLEDVQDDLGHRRTTRRYDRGRYRLDRSAAYKVAAALET